MNNQLFGFYQKGGITYFILYYSSEQKYTHCKYWTRADTDTCIVFDMAGDTNFLARRRILHILEDNCVILSFNVKTQGFDKMEDHTNIK